MNLKICFVSLAMFLATEVNAGNLKNIPKTLECQMDIAKAATTTIEFQTPLTDECKTVVLSGGTPECTCNSVGTNRYIVSIGEVKYTFSGSVTFGGYHTCPDPVDLALDDRTSSSWQIISDDFSGTIISIHGSKGQILLDGFRTCKVTSTF